MQNFPLPERIRGMNFSSARVPDFLHSKFYKGGNDARLLSPPFFLQIHIREAKGRRVRISTIFLGAKII